MNVIAKSHAQARFRLLLGLGLLAAAMALLFTPLPNDPAGRVIVGVMLGVGVLDTGLQLAWYIAHPVRRNA